MPWKKWLVRGSLGFLGGTVLLVIVANNQADKKNPDVHFTVQMETDMVSADVVIAALTAFSENCQPLTTKYWHNVLSAKAVVKPEPFPEQHPGAWKTYIEVEIALADKTDIPATNEYGVPNGHHLWYSLGGGSRPGFVARKRVSQAMCGMQVGKDQSDGFRDLAALRSLP